MQGGILYYCRHLSTYIKFEDKHPFYLYKMSLIPVSRDTMRSLKASADDATHITRLNIIIKEIYTRAIKTAKTSTNTSYTYQLLSHPLPWSRSLLECIEFYNHNMFEIITTLQSLFPNCSVKHVFMIRGKDGNLYDISIIDQMFLKSIKNDLKQEYISIDWS